MKTLLLLGGPMGVGKTTAARELNRLCPRSVLLDGDWCWQMNPFVVNDETKAMVLDNITHLIGNFLRCSQIDLVILSWVMDRREIGDELLSRLEGIPFRAVRVSLVCREEELVRRLERDVAAGIRQPDVIPRSRERLPLFFQNGSRLLFTDGITPLETAQRLLDCLSQPEGAETAETSASPAASEG